MLSPFVDGLLRKLRRLDVVFVIRKANIVQDFSYIGATIIDMKFFSNQVGNDPKDSPTFWHLVGE